jgi:hypothetical protein
MVRKIIKIRVFDFDSTLFTTPLPETGQIEYEKKTGKPWPHKGWWSKSETLDDSIFVIDAIESTIEEYNKELSDEILSVMMTGRIKKLSSHVEKILEREKLKFDRHYYNTGGSTLEYKLAMLDKLLAEFPEVTSIDIFDDRDSHIIEFQAWVDKKISDARLLEGKVIHVKI